MKIILSIFFFILFFSCGNNKQAGSKKVFRYNEDATLTSLDPAFARSQPNTWVISQLYNGLVQLDNDLKVRPSVAKAWEIDSSGHNYTFHLRGDVHFHDDDYAHGRLVTSHDFEYSFNRLNDKNVASPGAWVMKNIASLYCPDDSTFRITLKNTFPPFPGLLAIGYFAVVPKESVEHWGRDFRNHPVGTGPFKFKLWDEGAKLLLVKNENYFERNETGQQLPLIDGVSVSFVDNKLSAFLAFAKGELDFFNGLESGYKDEILNKNGTLKKKYDGRFRMESTPYMNTEYIAFYVDDTAANAVRNKLLRQAVSYAINREEIVNYLRNHIGTPAMYGITPEGFGLLNYDSLHGYGYDLAKAKKLAEEAGYGTQPFTVKYLTTSQYLDIAILLQNQLEKINVKMEIEVNQASFTRSMISQGKAQFFRGSWIADYADPENFLGLLYSRNFSPNGPNNSHFKNKEYDVLYESAMKELNDSLRYRLYEKMEKIALEESPLIFLFYDRTFHLVANNISGFSTGPQNIPNLKTVSIN